MTQARVLVVEDEPNIVESLRFILGRAGFAVEVASDGADALRIMRARSFAAVILDIMLPGVAGAPVLASPSSMDRRRFLLSVTGAPMFSG